MSRSGKPSFLTVLLMGAVVLGGVYWAYGKVHDTGRQLPVQAGTSALSAPEREALEIARHMDDLKALEGSLNAMSKKNEVRTAVDVAVLTAGKTVQEAEFEAAWDKIPESDRKTKSAEELASIIAGRLK